MLTCYSAILFLLNEYAINSTVTPDSVVEMTKLTPTMRLECLRKEPRCEAAHNAITKLLEQYDKFLRTTDASEQELLQRFATSELSRSHMEEAYEFGDSVAQALGAIGKGRASRFYRLLIV